MQNGSVAVSHNGVQVIKPMVAETIFPTKSDSNVPGSVYMKAGLYRRNLPATNNGQPVGTPQSPGGIGFILYHDEIERYQREALLSWPPRWPPWLPSWPFRHR
jgi:hypothetical protein